MLLAIKLSFIDLMIGTPPHTAASNSKLTLFSSAILDNWSPYFAISALLAVTTCFLFFNALKTNFFAGPSDPPINSTIISTCFLFFNALKTNFFAAPSAPPINSTIISTLSDFVASK